MSATAVLGDIHGDFERAMQLVGDLDDATPLVLVGDYFDRWPKAMEVVRWAMARPNTVALVGNHDALVLAVLEETARGAEGRATENWLWNGGQREDLVRLRDDEEAVDWLRRRPAMTVVGDTLVQHCDSPVYLLYGGSVDEVNRAIGARLMSHDADALFGVFAHLCRRRQFLSPADVKQYLAVFGLERLLHGHTPHTRSEALSMFNGSLVNVDGALSRGFGPAPRGFVHWIESA